MGEYKTAGVSQSVREAGIPKGLKTKVSPPPEKLFRTRDLELPSFEGSLPSCWLHLLHPYFLSAPKSQRFLRFAIAMPIAGPRNRAISETRDSNAALRFKGAMESR